jgi:oligosaccharyltransferase complex subunit beta
VTVALSAEATGYSHDPKKAMPEPPSLPVGGTAALVSLVQVRSWEGEMRDNAASAATS